VQKIGEQLLLGLEVQGWDHLIARGWLSVESDGLELVVQVTRSRNTFTPAEASEIRALLDVLLLSRRAERRIAMARLRRMGLGSAGNAETRPTREQFEDSLNTGALSIDEEAVGSVLSHPSGNVFRVAVGVTGQSIPETWSAFDQRYQWFGKVPRKVTSGAHLFVLAVDRWRSAVVGLYEAVSAGAAKLPNSPNPGRWPYALGVRPLAAIPPPVAERVEGQTGPQGGVPEQVSDLDARERLYRAVAASPPPPGPTTLEQRVQELEWRDVVIDVHEAIERLGGEARAPEVVACAVELGEWSAEELAARAWYTGGGVNSHVEHVLNQALWFDQGAKGSLKQIHGVYSLAGDAANTGFGVPYRRAVDGHPPKEDELPAHLVDIAELDRATKRHMELQDRLADALRKHDIEPRSPASWQPKFDLAFEYGERRFVVEVKSGNPVGTQQARLGAGQVLEYRHLLSDDGSTKVEPVLLLEAGPPFPWETLAGEVGLRLLRADSLEESLSALISDEA
jgi:hypothetical protein